MDHFGIGNAVQGMLHTYVTTARQSGRTTSLLESLKDGDRVVCVSAREADRLKHLCRERALKVDFIVVEPRQPQTLFQRPPPEGRTIFDHTWVESYYWEAMKRCQAEIDNMQRESSGRGTAHIETKRQYLDGGKRPWCGQFSMD